MRSGTSQNMKDVDLSGEERNSHLILAYDAISKRSASLNEEHGVGIAALTAPARAGAAIVPGPTAVENLSRLHSNGGRVRVRSGGRWDAALVAQACQGSWQG